MTTATATQTRYITKCFANGHTVQAARFADLHNGVWIKCPCGSYGPAKSMNVKIVAEKVCGSVCMGAQGPSCSCSCGGENHGANHTA
jgi:hypothetical protein